MTSSKEIRDYDTALPTPQDDGEEELGYDLEEFEDDEPEFDNDEDIYGPDGEVVYSPWYERMKVDRKCQGCGVHFKGMPDHGYCDRCADKIERGEDIVGE